MTRSQESPEHRTLRELTLEDPEYPDRVRRVEPPPETLTVDGLLTPAKVVAIVGTRHPTPAAAAFARELAGAVVRSGAVVASGGAVGIDAAAARAFDAMIAQASADLGVLEELARVSRPEARDVPVG